MLKKDLEELVATLKTQLADAESKLRDKTGALDALYPRLAETERLLAVSDENNRRLLGLYEQGEVSLREALRVIDELKAQIPVEVLEATEVPAAAPAVAEVVPETLALVVALEPAAPQRRRWPRGIRRLGLLRRRWQFRALFRRNPEVVAVEAKKLSLRERLRGKFAAWWQRRKKNPVRMPSFGFGQLARTAGVVALILIAIFFPWGATVDYVQSGLKTLRVAMFSKTPATPPALPTTPEVVEEPAKKQDRVAETQPTPTTPPAPQAPAATQPPVKPSLWDGYDETSRITLARQIYQEKCKGNLPDELDAKVRNLIVGAESEKDLEGKLSCSKTPEPITTVNGPEQLTPDDLQTLRDIASRFRNGAIQ